MSFEKIKYHTGGEIFEVKVKDTNGTLIENWVFMKNDFEKWVSIMRRKFGVMRIRKIDRDLDWAT